MIEENGVARLAKPKRKGILSLIFSRFFIIALLILIECAVVVIPVILLNEYIPHFVIVLLLFTIIMEIYLFNSQMDSTAKLTWMFLIATLRVGGAIFYLFTRANTGHRLIKEKTGKMVEDTMHALQQDPSVIERLRQEDTYTDDLLKYLNRSGCFPAYADTDVTYFPLGEDKFEAMLEELSKAEKFIYMEYFIIEEGYMWGKILNILIEKAKAGVDVRVMYDGMCEISNLPTNYCQLLEEQGIKAKAFSPIVPLLSSHYNYRDHRKICVIDGKTAFTGGVNLADEYINRTERFGHWKDTALMVKGDAARSYTLMFLQMWNATEKEPDFFVMESMTGYPALAGVPELTASSKAAQIAAPDSASDRSSDRSAVTADAAGNTDTLVQAGNTDTLVQAGNTEIQIPDVDKHAIAQITGTELQVPDSETKGFVIPYCDCPLDEDKVGEAVYTDILYRAGSYVHIMTPYLILDGELQTALMYAGQRGIDVKLILPGIPDKTVAYALAKTHYAALLAAGVKIYEYTPGFVHAKVCVSDDEKGVVGTINFDYRSLYHHFECAAYLYKTPCIADIEKDFQETLSKCRQVTWETLKNEKTLYKIIGPIAKFIAPLM